MTSSTATQRPQSAMPEHLKPTNPLSHAQSLREEAVRRLSRSPHPYHRQQFELPHSSERSNPTSPSTQSPLRSTQNTDDEGQESSRPSVAGYRESNSDSGTEADDEHFLKGLPAPKLRPHKGLRDGDNSLSTSPSPLLSPVALSEDAQKIPGYLRKVSAALAVQSEEDAAKVLEKLRRKRKIEIIRRLTEAALLMFVGGVLCLNTEVRSLLGLFRRGWCTPFCYLSADPPRTIVSGSGNRVSSRSISHPTATAFKPNSFFWKETTPGDSCGLRSRPSILPSRDNNARFNDPFCQNSKLHSAKYNPRYILTS